MVILTVFNIRRQAFSDNYRMAFAWGSLVSYLNGALNPIIYAYRCDAIGREIRKLVAKCMCRGSGIEPTSTQIESLQQ